MVKKGLIDLYFRSWRNPPHMMIAQNNCGGANNFCPTLGALAEDIGADIALLKAIDTDLPLTESKSHGMSLPKSIAFANCDDDSELKELCKKVKCEAVCWVDREDGVKPNIKVRVNGEGAGDEPVVSHKLILCYFLARSQWKSRRAASRGTQAGGATGTAAESSRNTSSWPPEPPSRPCSLGRSWGRCPSTAIPGI